MSKNEGNFFLQLNENSISENTLKLHFVCGRHIILPNLAILNPHTSSSSCFNKIMSSQDPPVGKEQSILHF